MFQLATEEGFLSHLTDRVAKLRLSLYADDAMLFINPDHEDVRKTMMILQRFGEAT